MKYLVLALMLAISSCMPAPAFADPGPSSNFTFTGKVRSYVGALDYCKREPAECRGEVSVTVPWSEELMAQLDQANRLVNGYILPKTDLEAFQRNEHWTIIPPGVVNAAGDCEDYALTKRDILIDDGVPAGALRLVILKIMKTGEDHAVLGVVTDRGLYLLDNLQPDIKTIYSPLGYHFISQQIPESFDQFEVIRGISN